jgi:hypothetical protein
MMQDKDQPGQRDQDIENQVGILGYIDECQVMP